MEPFHISPWRRFPLAVGAPFRPLPRSLIRGRPRGHLENRSSFVEQKGCGGDITRTDTQVSTSNVNTKWTLEGGNDPFNLCVDVHEVYRFHFCRVQQNMWTAPKNKSLHRGPFWVWVLAAKLHYKQRDNICP